MKKVLILAVVALMALAASAESSAAPEPAKLRGDPGKCKPDEVALPFNPATPFYALSDCGPEALSTTDYVDRLPAWLKGERRALLFVHGRGDEPTKSVIGRPGPVKGQALKELTSRTLRPMLFNWDSAAATMSDRRRPLAHVDAAACAFAEMLKAYAELRVKQPDLPLPVLLVHSMGAIVIQRTVERGAWPKQMKLFERLVFSEPDADRDGHEHWMGELARQESVWVTWNRSDIVLDAATDAREDGVRALGLGVRWYEPLAEGVRYVNLSFIGPCCKGWFNHTVFVAGSFGNQPLVDCFMDRLLAGDAIDPRNDSAAREVDGRGVIRLKSGPGPGPAYTLVD